MAFQGVYTAIVTPFAEDGSVDWDELDRIVEFQIEGGVQGIVPCGTTGESPTLSHEEHRQVIERVTKKTAGRAHVMAGCGSNSTREAVGLTRHAAEIGVDSTLQVCPYYNKPSQEGMYRHFKAIAEATDKPIVLYNIPGRTGINMAPETIARLSELPTV
ncbi:MAG: 4-hydroxy-tetrahydrodipicolinate synthase, partial [Planctomycetota bacterium]